MAVTFTSTQGGSGSGSGDPVDGEVANFSALPSAAASSGLTYRVLAEQGTWLLGTLKRAGDYYSDGVSWTHLGTSAYIVKAYDTATTDNALVKYHSTDGQSIQETGVIVDDSNNISGVTSFNVDEIAAPGTPASNTVVMYAKADGKMYIKDDTGTETDLTAGAAGGNAWSDAVNADIVPDADGTRDLGNTTTRFAETYTDALDVTNNITVGGTVDGRDIAADGTKLDGIEASADVTDATNVDAAGAVMNTDTSIASMSFVIDEDSMVSNLDTKVPTQQSVKTYVDAQDANIASDTLTFTNKTFDANATGNSLSNVDVADLANGTDGELITWDATGAPATVSAGTSGQVLTSNGAGAAPTFQAAAGGTSQGGAFGNSPGSVTTYTSHPMADFSSTATAVGSSSINYMPIYCNGQTYTRIGVNIASTSLSGGETARLGIYECKTDGSPGALVLDAGTVDITTTGDKEITISETLTGNYFLAYVANGSCNPVTNSVSDSHQTLWGTTSSSGSVDVTILTASSGSEHSGLSDPALTVTTGSVVTNSVRVWLREV